MTKEEFREIEILLGGLQVVGLLEGTNERLEKSLQVMQRDKQLIITDVVKSFTADEVADMLVNKFTTIEEAIHFFDMKSK